MTLPDRIKTDRLRLILVTPDDAADMRAGRRQDRWHPSYPRPDDVDAASMVRADDPWGPRHVVLGHQAVGTIGCFGPPEDGETEVGFGLVADVRGQRIATEALTAYVAEADRLGVRLTRPGPARQRRQPPGARPLRLHRAPRLDRRRRAGARAAGSVSEPPPPPMTTPRLVATDLDGTLVRTDGSVSPATREVLAELDRRGVPVVIVTARPIRWMDDLWPLVGRHGLAVVSNGAAVVEVRADGDHRVRDVRGIDVEAGLALVEAVRKAAPEASFAVECVSGLVRDPSYVEAERVPRRQPGRRARASSGPSRPSSCS